MSTWLRLALITMSVGGGFTGAVLTSEMLVSSLSTGPFLVIIGAVFLLLYLFVLASGLLFVQDPRRVLPLAIAFALQIPVISSPLVTYHFGAGLHGAAGFNDTGLFFWIRLGSEWRFYLLKPLPWGFGINIVAVVFLATLAWSTSRQRRQSELSDTRDAVAHA